MCCFSGPVKDVAATRIYARMAQPGRQILAYEMVFAATRPVAMILPVPTPVSVDEHDVRFISLEHYPHLFEDLFRVFVSPPRGGAARGMIGAAPTLVVHEVGAFVASFVPTLADFARLDPQFRIPAGTVDRVPEYRDYGFVVFQLGATTGRSRVHPMAFEFSTRDAGRLFFPLVHVHDGQLHGQAMFDHVLYAQGVKRADGFTPWGRPLGEVISNRHAGLVLDLAIPASRREMHGLLPNRDVWVDRADGADDLR